MPPKKTTTTRKPTYKKKMYKKRSFAQRVKDVVQSQQETKSVVYFTTERNQDTLTSPSLIFNLNNTTQGTDAHQRVGDSVRGMLMNVRGTIHSPHVYPIWHRMLVLERNFQSDPNLDLFEDNTGNYAPATQDIGAIYARINTTKYKVLAQKVFKTGTQSGIASDYGADKLFNFTFRTPGKYVYDDGESRPQKRNIILVYLARRGDNDDAMGSNFELSLNAKWYFKDA